MITDNNLRLSGGTTVAAAAFTTAGVPTGYPAGQVVGNAGSEVSDNIIDLGVARDIGEGQPLYAVFTVTETFNNLTSLDMEIFVNATADYASTPTTLVKVNKTLADGGLAAGQQHVLTIPPIIAGAGQRYLGAYYTINGSNPTTGKVVCDIVTDIEDGKKFYANGYTII